MTIGIDIFLARRMCANLPGMPALRIIGADDENRIIRRGGPHAS